MTYKGHLAGGVAAAALSAQALPLELQGAALVAVAALVGSLAPDMDQPGSYLGRRSGPLPYLWRMMISNPLTWWVAGAARAKKSGVLRRLSAGRKRMRRLAGHRGLSHSLLGLFLAAFATLAAAGIALALLAGFAPAVYDHFQPAGPLFGGYLEDAVRLPVAITLGFGAGYVSHILLDMMTVSGVPLLLPGTDRRFWVLPKPLRVRTS